VLANTEGSVRGCAYVRTHVCAGFGACVRRHFIQLHRLTRACEQQAQRKAQMIMFFSAALFYTRSVFVSCPGLSLCLLSLSLSLTLSLSLSISLFYTRLECSRLE
jgi:hypothetical protein